ncbi:MAG: hypothetical protein ABG776_15080 [Cyanobacteria bacterium J06555_13]
MTYSTLLTLYLPSHKTLSDPTEAEGATGRSSYGRASPSHLQDEPAHGGFQSTTILGTTPISLYLPLYPNYSL